jgi:hypothetical protein
MAKPRFKGPELFTLPPQSGISCAYQVRQKLNKGLYADAPGTGPQGETCRSCRHLCRVNLGNTYLKCGLTRQWWTGGGATDIKARAPACSKWEAK